MCTDTCQGGLIADYVLSRCVYNCSANLIADL